MAPNWTGGAFLLWKLARRTEGLLHLVVVAAIVEVMVAVAAIVVVMVAAAVIVEVSAAAAEETMEEAEMIVVHVAQAMAAMTVVRAIQVGLHLQRSPSLLHFCCLSLTDGVLHKRNFVSKAEMTVAVNHIPATVASTTILTSRCVKDGRR